MSTEAGFDEDVAMWPIGLAIAVAVIAGAGAAWKTGSAFVGLGAYLFVVCLTYVLLWVSGYA